MGERVRSRMEALGLGFNELDRTIGQSSGYTTRLVAGKKKRPDPAILEKIAQALGVTIGWIVSGEGDATPPTPPAKSDVRSKGEAIERDDIEYVDAWFFESLQELGGKRRYSVEQVQAAKRFLVWGSAKLQDGDPRKMVLGALEAAKELDETGQVLSSENIFALLIEKNAPPSGPESGAREHDAAMEFTKDYIRKESKKALKGFTPKPRGRRER